jgi:hypothetical protein
VATDAVSCGVSGPAVGSGTVLGGAGTSKCLISIAAVPEQQKEKIEKEK